MNHLLVLLSIMLPQGKGKPRHMQTIGLHHTLTLGSGRPCTPVPAQQNRHTHKLVAMLHLCGGPFLEALVMGLLRVVAPTGHLHMQLLSLQSSSTCTLPYMQAQGRLAPAGQFQIALLCYHSHHMAGNCHQEGMMDNFTRGGQVRLAAQQTHVSIQTCM